MSILARIPSCLQEELAESLLILYLEFVFSVFHHVIYTKYDNFLLTYML